MSTNKLYTLLIAVALTFNVACDGDETITNEGGTETGGAPVTGGTPGGVDMPGGMDMPGGEMPGGEMPGGEMPGGEMPGGEMPGGVEMPERMGLGDTDAVSCDGDYCPSGRLNSLTLPANRDEATTSGCRLAGSENGATLGGLLGLLGGTDLNSFVNPDENGEISLVLLNHLAGWGAGATGNEAGEVTANFYVGDYVDGSSFISPSSLNEEGEAYISFPGTTITDGLMRTPESSFALSLPLLEGFNLDLSLESASLVGDVAVDEVGFALSNGVLGGYLTKDGLVAILEGLYSACGIGRPAAVEPQPDFCGTVAGSGLITGMVDIDLGLLTGFVPFDTILDDAGLSACTPDRADDCNAISLCLVIGMESTTIRGISEE